MLPDLNMDIKWAYYDDPALDEEGDVVYEKNEDGSYKLDENNNKIISVKPIIFSCVCDGNSLINKFELELTWSDTINDTLYYFKKVFLKKSLALYPIDYNNEYVPIELEVRLSGNGLWDGSAEYYSEDKSESEWPKTNDSIYSFAKDKKVTAKYILTSAEGQEVYNYATFDFKSKPDLIIQTIAEKGDPLLLTEEITLSSSDQIFYGTLTSSNPVQYYYWEVYDSDKNLIFQSNKIYSQDIQFKYSNFLNNNTYKIKCIVYNNIGEIISAEKEFSISYDSTPVNIDYSYRILPKETGIYFEWDEINVLSGRLYNQNGQEIFINENNYSDYIIQEELNISGEDSVVKTKLLNLTGGNYLSLKNLSFDNSEIFYWAGYIHPEYNIFYGWQPVFSISWIDDNNLSHITQLEKSNDQNLRITDNGIDVSTTYQWVNLSAVSSNILKNYNKGITTWYIIALNLNDSKIYISDYFLNGLPYPGDDWQEDENGNNYILLTNGVWEESEGV